MTPSARSLTGELASVGLDRNGQTHPAEPVAAGARVIRPDGRRSGWSGRPAMAVLAPAPPGRAGVASVDAAAGNVARRAALAGLALLACLSAWPCVAAGDASAGLAPGGPAPGLVVVGGAGVEQVVTPEALAAMPAVSVTQTIGHGAHEGRFEGPLLWTLLGQAGAVDPAKVHDETRQTVTLTGQDGYVAVLALGEISPEFEGKTVIVAERLDGAALGERHLRVVVPGDKRGGRGVHDLVRITVSAP